MKLNYLSYFWLSTIFIFLFSFNFTAAKTDLSISETDITFSKSDIIDGDVIKIYARIFNTGDTDVSGYVSFLYNGKEIAEPLAISVKPNTYDDVFTDWKAMNGNYNIEAKIIGTSLKDDNVEDNKITKSVFVDFDTDKDGVPNAKDEDIDGDQLLNNEEIAIGTDVKNPDTDQDTISDKIDVFPLDKTEWRDTDHDSLGDNSDPDIDGDQLPNDQEIHTYGTNPLNIDTDGDGLWDGQEIKDDTNPTVKDDTSYKLENTFKKLDKIAYSYIPDDYKEYKQYIYAGLGIILFIIILFLLRKRNK